MSFIMPSIPELTGGISQTPEKPLFTEIEPLCGGVKIVQMATGERKYMVSWMKGDLPARSFMGTIQAVLHQHERVIEKYLGIEIPLAAEGLLRIPGETQKMAELSSRLSSLAAKFLIPLRSGDSSVLKSEVEAICQKISRATNKYKQKAKTALDGNKILEANLEILSRNEECLKIVQGTLRRFRTVSNQRDLWERTIEESFYRLAQRLKELEGEISEKEKKQMVNEISGARAGILARLNKIAGPEYCQRVQTREVQNLAEFGNFLNTGDEPKAKKILQGALFKLERVVREKQERALNLGKRGEF